jgi:signal transduction histidine kinase
MGLGLTLARQIVDAHLGRLRCENRVPHGACFTAELYVDGPR